MVTNFVLQGGVIRFHGFVEFFGSTELTQEAIFTQEDGERNGHRSLSRVTIIQPRFTRKELLCNLEHGIYNMERIHRFTAKSARNVETTDEVLIFSLWLRN